MKRTWSWPLLLAATTFFGLASGIFGEGAWDWLCWAGLSVPVIVLGRKAYGQYALYRQYRRSDRP